MEEIILVTYNFQATNNKFIRSPVLKQVYP